MSRGKSTPLFMNNANNHSGTKLGGGVMSGSGKK